MVECEQQSIYVLDAVLMWVSHRQFVEFIGTADPKFEKYDLDAAWPSLIDEYVEHCKAKLARGEQIKAADSMDE